MYAFLKASVFVLLASTLICASPVSKREVTLSSSDTSSSESSTDTEPPNTTSVDDPPTTTQPPVIEEEFVIHKHEGEDLVAESADGEPEVVHREIDEYIVEPNGEEYIVVSETEDDLFDAAESGLVFRPRFQYSQVQRQRRYRTPIRRRYYYRRN